MFVLQGFQLQIYIKYFYHLKIQRNIKQIATSKTAFSELLFLIESIN